MEVSVGDVVLPGDRVKDTFIQETVIKNKQDIILGPGLRTDSGIIYACKAGILKNKLSLLYVDNYQKRYIPSEGENVVGVVTQKAGDIFKVDIGASEAASLSYLGFEGASKRNRPDVQAGDIVYAKVLVASKDMEPELVCIDSFGKKGKLGVLDPSGMLFSCSLSLVRKILKPGCPLLPLLSEELKSEVAIGVNGKIWIKSKANVQDTIAIANAILVAEYTAPDELPLLCNSIMKSLVKVK